jgi:glycosyltransferase involved in cell wall biosynthesis
MRARLGYASDDFVLGTVARLDPRKGLDTVVDALSVNALRHPRLRFLVVGDGGERTRLAARAEAHGVAGRVAFVPHQIHVTPYLAAMDLFVAPSRTEGLGLAIIEALAAGVPVLASSVGGIPEVVEDGVCGRLLPPDDVKRWAAAIGVAAMDRERLTRWREDSPKQAARFSIEASVENLARFYEEPGTLSARREAA